MTGAELIIKIIADDKELQATLKGIASKLKAVMGMSVAGLSLKKIFTDSLDAASAYEEKLDRLRDVLKATGGISGMTAQSLLETASALKDVTVFSQGAIIEAETVLLGFTKIGKDVFPQATAATLDLADKMKTDAASAARLLGRALQEPEQGIRALKAADIILSEAEKKLIKDLSDTGKAAEAQRFILDKLSGTVGGMAERSGTYADKTQVLSNEINSLAKNTGNIFLPEMKRLVQTAGEILSVVNKMIVAARGPSIEAIPTEILQKAVSDAQEWIKRNPKLFKLGFNIGFDREKIAEAQQELKKRAEETRNAAKGQEKQISEEARKKYQDQLKV